MVTRRVVVGEENGRSVVLREEVASLGPLAAQEFIWRCEVPPALPNGGEISEETSRFPAAGGVWVMRWELQPGVALDGASEDGSGAISFDADRPGYHQTDSVDVNFVLSGRIVLQLDDEEVELSAGDVVVVNGSTHAWRNPGEQTAVVLGIMAGASRRS